ncbi:uncharacterized protein LOC109880116 isoform X1 [Oncorhynchus kisutch]|uniref:uncharacterized protein LOC109880116 isoform X1 n=2 Tax=Oncorhynchus kisutch TaxID=8019 RepID=UPI0012DE6445|nr:uncharacterized protein LOC109880116 isoform X1 [Oncorhynchus kisutch]
MGSMFDLSVAVRLYLLSCFVVSVDFTLGLGQSQDTEFTFQLPAGRTECFYQTATKNGSLEVEYQVIAGGGLDVGFTLISPSGYKLASEFRTSDGIHTVDPTEDGDYRLCFDNSFSKLSEKMVFFEVIVEGQPGDTWGDEEWADMAEPESMVEYKLEDIRVRRTGGTPKRSATGTGDHGLSAQAPGAEPAASDHAEGLRGPGPLSTGGQSVEGLVLVLHEPPGHPDRGRHTGLYPPTPLRRQEGLQSLVSSSIFHHPHTLPSGIFHHPHTLPSGIFQHPHTLPSGIFHHHHTLPSGIFHHPHTLPSGIFHHPHTLPSGIFHHPHTLPSGIFHHPHTLPSGIFHHPHTLPSGIFHHPHTLPSGIFQQTHTRPDGIFHHPHTLPSGIFHHPHTLPSGIFHHPHTLPSGIFHHPHTLPSGIFHHPHTLPSGIFHKDAIEGCWD